MTATPSAAPASADLTCPKCGAHNGLLELLRDGLTFCNGCSARICFDAAGVAVRVLQR